ncbi:MAG: 50S ribosomal protein L25/general stress protein Ctc [Kiloniellales bacterium]|jgi:large subunit ribosomal protein L25|nr:50S ribosomal protein L25/general stress protein Ctc [Kiloniellales bacterium]
MSQIHNLSAEPKERAGKGAARAARRAGRIPGVIYGAKQPPLMITLDPQEMSREMRGGGFFTTLFDVKVNGGSERVLARDLQLHPVSERPLHVDFLRVSSTTVVVVEVPCHFVNDEESPGIKRGGVLNVVRHTLELSCRADAIPNEIVIDLTGLEIGDSVHISQIDLPEGVKPTITDRDFTVASIAAPSVVKEEAAEEAEGEEEAEEGFEVDEEGRPIEPEEGAAEGEEKSEE